MVHGWICSGQTSYYVLFLDLESFMLAFGYLKYNLCDFFPGLVWFSWLEHCPCTPKVWGFDSW